MADPRDPQIAVEPPQQSEGPLAPDLPQGSRRRTTAAGRVLVVGLVCFLLWTLLDAGTLERSAASSPLGGRRTVALAILKPILRLSRALGFDQLGSTLRDALGRDGHGPPLTQPGPTPIAGPSPTLPPALPAVRVPTEGDPLRILVVGDSLGEDMGGGLERRFDASDLVDVIIDARTSTGLARPDYFDWPTEVRLDLERYDPDLVVAMFGGNDNQSFIVRDQGIRFGTREWADVYGARVAEVMAEVTAAGRRLAWVGMPVMKSPSFSAQVRMLNRVYRTRAQENPNVIYVDSWHLYVDARGRYSAYLPTGTGHQELVRQPDGVHITVAGSDRLGGYLLRVMRSAWSLPV